MSAWMSWKPRRKIGDTETPDDSAQRCVNCLDSHLRAEEMKRLLLSYPPATSILAGYSFFESQVHELWFLECHKFSLYFIL